MKILVACEESQAVTIAFRSKGHEAFSCDVQECSGGYPEWHIQGDALKEAYSGNYDMMIAFPPCTYLTVAANRHFVNNPERWKARYEAMLFVYDLLNAPIDKIALENPIDAISTYIRPPEQIVNPFYFGDNVPKKTCLWLKNLSPLIHSANNTLFDVKTHVEPEYLVYNSKSNKSGKSKYSVFGKQGKGHGKTRSKTFPGIANAMAEQWG
ncbi:hypothetical protein GR160_02945 [Flavobacterium sp. Sd200]|uniref:hypothetical protein n=1 Tax=Flavobacterium sp. Sd200 TaxID=2692211 RepID=UPI00136E0F73|nr:hypothetical protein [Flavobacterium sp. Sd200]MXN90171.1 hypothetical protein [Flavobacterium sp. Sd200]